MKLIFIVASICLLSCGSEETKPDPKIEALNDLINDFKAPVCPQFNHTDSIVPIAYGYPTEDMFAQEDSGKIVLGGCELGENNHYCLKHNLSFP